jgi:hypothetical protein
MISTMVIDPAMRGLFLRYQLDDCIQVKTVDYLHGGKTIALIKY